MQTATRPTETLPSDAQSVMARMERAMTAPDAAVIEKVRTALGFRSGWTPRTHLGETPTLIREWTQAELNDRYERVGGTVTARTVQRSTDDGETTWAATEITLTTEVPGVGYVQLVTDWDEETGGRDLPVMQQIADAELIA